MIWIDDFCFGYGTASVRAFNKVLAGAIYLILALMLLGCNGADDETAIRDRLNWTSLPEVPGGIGVAGPYTGISNHALILAAGPTFLSVRGRISGKCRRYGTTRLGFLLR